jgi:hypothetical protein
MKTTGTAGHGFLCAKTSTIMSNFELEKLKLYFRRRIFLGKDPHQGQVPGLLGHGFKRDT